MSNELLSFLQVQIANEWHEFVEELRNCTDEMLTWQPSARTHSMGWHFRHVLEWRYAVVHVVIAGQPSQERLTCLGWEDHADVRRLVSNPGQWYEPRDTVAQIMELGERVRRVTDDDLAKFPPEYYFREHEFPWAKNRLLDEMFEDCVRHSAMHRGQIRELKKAWARAQGQRGSA